MQTTKIEEKETLIFIQLFSILRGIFPCFTNEVYSWAFTIFCLFPRLEGIGKRNREKESFLNVTSKR